MKGNSFDSNRMVWSKVLMSENFDMDQRGDHSMHVVPPLVLIKNSKIEKLVFMMKKRLVFMKGNSFDSNRMVWSKVLMSENFDMDQRGDHTGHVVPPLLLIKN